MCSNYGDGTYTLPVPDSPGYHDYISGMVSGNTEIPLGFSDEQEEGNWINVYNSKWTDKIVWIMINFIVKMNQSVGING